MFQIIVIVLAFSVQAYTRYNTTEKATGGFLTTTNNEHLDQEMQRELQQFENYWSNYRRNSCEEMDRYISKITNCLKSSLNRCLNENRQDS